MPSDGPLEPSYIEWIRMGTFKFYFIHCFEDTLVNTIQQTLFHA